MSDAAAVLGLSPDAMRKRLERGQIRGEKQDGRWLVAPLHRDSVPGQPRSAGPSDRTRPSSSGQTGPSSGDAASLLAAKDAALSRADAEIAYLRTALEARSRELADERERADTLHRLALLRIEALTAETPVPATDEPEPDSPPGNAPRSAKTGLGAMEDASPGDESKEGSSDTEKTRRAPWWRRLIFGERT